MKQQILWLRIAYWTGIVIDALSFAMLLNPALWATVNGVSGFVPDWDFRYSQSFAAALMAGWTVLLFWADRKPLERRGILVITAFPVVVGLNGARWLLYTEGIVPMSTPLKGMVLPALLCTLFLFAYFNSLRKTA